MSSWNFIIIYHWRRVKEETDTDQANPQFKKLNKSQTLMPQSSNWRRSNIYKTCILFSPNVFLLNIAKTNYKAITGPVTSGSKFLLVQKHFALVQD